MELRDIASIVMPAIGLIGLGGALVSIYMRLTLAETIIEKLNGRYVSANTYNHEMNRMVDRMVSIEHRMECLEGKVDAGFREIRTVIKDAAKG